MADAQTPSQFQRSETSRTYSVQEEPKAGIFSNILAIVGFIILIVVVIWGLVNLAGISRGWFSSFFSARGGIQVSAPKSATSGTPFSISWKYNEPTKGTYAFLYPCQNGFQLQTPSPTGAMNGIPCGAAFTLGGEKNLSLTPYLKGMEALDMPLTVIFMPSSTSSQQVQGSATVKIMAAQASSTSPAPSPAPTPTATPAPTPAPTPGPSAPVSKGPADLAVRITSASIDVSGEGVVTFDIENIGGSSSGTYYFVAELPVSGGYTYSSDAQAPLAPGAHILNTLRFSEGIPGTFSVSLTTGDSNRSNNDASQFVNGSSYGPVNYGPVYPAYTAQYAAAYYPMNQMGYPQSYPEPYMYPQTYAQPTPYYGGYVESYPYAY